eukprot:TRINITY_DN72454_c0_g1_i1.p1 TRINITY_DN72454_c0_g1~~TRINITY_DN72454_c0_g1_i1.p1  ORF type:complete len:531 (+),score=115.94 TRINITY_DN72454_c0_g1_i1:32-1624(+)
MRTRFVKMLGQMSLFAVVAMLACLPGASASRPVIGTTDQKICKMEELVAKSPLTLSIVDDSCSTHGSCNFFQFTQDNSKLLARFLQKNNAKVGRSSKCICSLKPPSEGEACSTFDSSPGCPNAYCTWTGSVCKARELVRYRSIPGEPCTENWCWRKYTDFVFLMRNLEDDEIQRGVLSSVTSGNHWQFSCQEGQSTSVAGLKSAAELLDDLEEESPDKRSQASKSLWNKIILPKKRPGQKLKVPATSEPSVHTDRQQAPATIAVEEAPATVAMKEKEGGAVSPTVAMEDEPPAVAMEQPAGMEEESATGTASEIMATGVIQSLAEASELQSDFTLTFQQLSRDANELNADLRICCSGLEVAAIISLCDKMMHDLGDVIEKLASDGSLVAVFDALTDLKSVDQELFMGPLEHVESAIQFQTSTQHKLEKMMVDMGLLKGDLLVHADVSTGKQSVDSKSGGVLGYITSHLPVRSKPEPASGGNDGRLEDAKARAMGYESNLEAVALFYEESQQIIKELTRELESAVSEDSED